MISKAAAIRILSILVISMALSSCGFIYRQDVQQGNILDQEMVDNLRPGMTKRQVILVLGTPAVENPFRHNRWDYVSSYKPAGGEIDTQRLTVYFENDRLTRIEGDYFPDAALMDGEPTTAEVDTDN
ncbi:MAG: hypothetical protein DHS20C11_10760 [Lysobacteraceae bacterium]|nr:MAG: hypothetical protein DHS20C11_10760 [Xanthomonadaceae bacterium]